MPDMLTVAVVYTALAYLATWDVGLAVRLLPGPLSAALVLDFLIVTACLVVVLVKLQRARWLF